MAKTTGRYSTNYGIYSYYSDFTTMTNNRVVCAGTSSNYGLYVYYNDGFASNKVLVANNMVSSLDNSGTTYGIYVYNCTQTDVYHNTVHSNEGTASTSSNRPFYGYCSSTSYGPIEVTNNSFSNMGKGYAAYIYNSYGCFTALNNNNFYTNGTTFGYYYGPSGGTTTHSSWASFQTAMGVLGQNSISVAPLFTSDRDLHTITPGLDAQGATGLPVTTDIDGETRCPGAGCPGAKSAPDIGADEFDPPQNDAGAVDVSLPCPGLTDVFVTVQNFGIAPLNTVVITATVNGSATSGSGLVYNVGGLASGATTVVNVGNFNFAGGVNYTIAAATSNPNGVADQNASNDNDDVQGFPSFGGVITVGGTNPDFTTIEGAVNAMEASGVCAPVTVHVREGIYNEQVWIDNIPGTNATNTVTIMPDPANTMPVEITYGNATSAKATVVRFSGTSYVTLKDIKISNTSSTYKRAIAFVNNNDHITIDGVDMYNVPTSTSTNQVMVWNQSGTSSLTEYCTIKNCTLDGGSYGLYWYGGSTTVMEAGNQFLNNTIKNYYYYGIRWQYQTNSVIDGNDITPKASGYTYNYGLYSYYSDFGQITNNRVVTAAPSYNYGLYVYYNDGSSSQKVLVANNMVSCLDNQYTVYGLYCYNSTHVNLYHNTIYVNKGYTTSSGRAVYLYGSSTTYGPIEYVNNIAVNTGGGYAGYIYNRYNLLSKIDNNNWYSSGNTLGYFYAPSGGTTTHSSLASWVSKSGEQNSQSEEIAFDAPDDLHHATIALDGTGMNGLGIAEDIDGDVRCPGGGCPGSKAAPDPGADEYDVPPLDLGISDIINPVDGLGCDYRQFEPAIVTIKNYGSEPVNLALTPATLSVTTSGASSQSISFTVPFGTIPVGGTLNWPVGVLDMTSGGLHIVDASVAVAGDGKAKNDHYLREINVSIISTYPYAQNFDNWAPCGTGASTVCNLEDGWENTYSDDMDWLTDFGGTSSGSTGPADDVSGGGNYLYIETSSPNYPNKEAIMNLPCFNIGNMGCPVMSFAYHMYGANTGKLQVEIFDGQNWINVYTLSGQQQTSNAAPWAYAQILLDNFTYLGVIKVRILGSSGPGTFTSDIAIDDFSLLDLASSFVLDARVSSNTISTCDILEIEGYANSALNTQKWDITPGTMGVDWDIINGSLSDRNATLVFHTPGTYALEFTGITTCNTTREDVETVVVTQGAPVADFTANTQVGTQAITTFTLTDQVSPTANDWFWQILPGREGTDYVFTSGNARSASPSFIFLRPGRYNVRLTAGTACGTARTSKFQFFDVRTLRPSNGVIPASQLNTSLDKMESLTAYPNPFENTLNVNFVSVDNQPAKLSLANMIGKVVHTEVMDNMEEGLAQAQLNLAENLSAGVYVLTVTQGTNTQSIRVIKE